VLVHSAHEVTMKIALSTAGRVRAVMSRGQAGSLPQLPESSLILGAIISPILALLVIVRVLVGLGLFADGSPFLVGILQKEWILDFDPPRWFAHIVSQMPVIALIKVGVRRMDYIIYAHSAGLIAIPAILWLTALWTLRGSGLFWPFFAVFSVVYLNSSFFVIGEYNLAFGLAAAAMALLLHPKPLTFFGSVFLVMLAVLSIRSYQVFVMFGPVILCTAILRWKLVARRGHIEGAAVIGSALCFGVATVSSLFSILHPQVPGSVANAANILSQLNNPQLIISAISAFLYIAALSVPWSRAARISLFGGSILFCVPVIFPSIWSWPVQHYGSRTVCGILLTFLFAWISLQKFGPLLRPKWASYFALRAGGNAHVAVPMAMFLALLVPNFAHSAGFYKYLKAFEHIVSSHEGRVTVSQAGMDTGALGLYDWGWSDPARSVILRSGCHNALIIDRHTMSLPFDPDGEVPCFSDYRMNAYELFRW
jgi:hypothetical protein